MNVQHRLVKFVHAADLHLDSPLCGLERYEGAPVERVRGATRRAFERLIDLCLSEDAAFLLLAGDIFDGDWKDYGTGLFFVAQLARLGKAGVPTYLVRGNHDAASEVTRYLNLPAQVHAFSAQRAHTEVLEAHGVAIHGRSFATRAVTEDLALEYPLPVRGLLNIGLLHTSVEGRVGHEPYAPCTVASLTAKGYDYWALGHVHAREVLATEPWIVFPGNLQGRHARETGAKGATVVTVDKGRIVAVEPRALDVVRWTRCEVDAVDAVSAAEAIARARSTLETALSEADGRLVAAPVTVRASRAVCRALAADREKWIHELRALALDVAGDDLWIERVRFQTPAAETASRPERLGGGGTAREADSGLFEEDAIAPFVTALRAMRDDEGQLLTLADELTELRNRLPSEAKDGEDGLRLEEPGTLRRLLDEVESLVVGRLANEGQGERP